MASVDLKLSTAQKQLLSQQMLQSLQILQMSAAELESYIENLALENPVIELAGQETHTDRTEQMELQRKLDWLSSADPQNHVYYQSEWDAEDPENNWQDRRSTEETLEDYLRSQLLTSPCAPEEQGLMDCLLNSLDSRGWFTDSLSGTAALYGLPEETAERLLGKIQSLDPAGVGARSLSECLLLQLERNPDSSETAKEIVRNHLEAVGKNHLPEIARKLGCPVAEIAAACDEIRALNPKPGSSFSSRELLGYIVPDAVIISLEDRFEILINDYQYAPFTISKNYLDLERETEDRETRKYLREKIAEANNVSAGIRQRSSTLAAVLNVIVDRQYQFFRKGPGNKQLLRLSEIAEQVSLSESTVSRALHSKYLQCRFGIFPLNYFLTAAAVVSENSGEAFTAEKIKQALKEIIDGEDKKKPLSDSAISEALAKEGMAISRRTVNKYRAALGIPDKAGRRSWDA